MLRFIVIAFLLTKLPRPETAKGPFGLRVKLPPAQCPSVFHTSWRFQTVLFFTPKSSKEAVNTNSYSFCFASTGNRTRVYRFSSRRFIHSNTDRIPSFQLRSTYLLDNLPSVYIWQWLDRLCDWPYAHIFRG